MVLSPFHKWGKSENYNSPKKAYSVAEMDSIPIFFLWFQCHTYATESRRLDSLTSSFSPDRKPIFMPKQVMCSVRESSWTYGVVWAQLRSNNCRLAVLEKISGGCMTWSGVSKMHAAAAAKSLQSCATLCDPIDGSPPGSPVPGTLQARTLEWVAISFSNAWKWKVQVKSFSRVWLLATPWIAAQQGPPSMGFSRQEHWSGLPFSSPLKCIRVGK